MASREEGVVVSWITDVKIVYSSSGAAAYLGDYLQKQEGEREALDAMGFKRRWSRTNGWPADELLRRKGTADEQWVRHVWSPGEPSYATKAIEASAGHPLLERVGGRIYLELADKMARSSLENRVKRSIRNASVP